MATAILASKTCTKCNINKSVCEFTKHSYHSDGLQSHCKACRKEKLKIFYSENSSKIKAVCAQYRDGKKDIIKEKRAKKYLLNPAAYIAKSKARYAQKSNEINSKKAAKRKENPNEYRKQYLEYFLKNKERIKAVNAAWAKENKDSIRIRAENRRSKKSSSGVISKDITIRLFKAQRGLCPCCNQPLGRDFHLDHIMPIHLGGSNTDDNIQLLRSTCNQQKHAKHPIDFMQSRGFLL